MSQVFKGPQNMEVEIILTSVRVDGRSQPLHTLRARYPRIIHAELMTHRVFGRNARSSRAVPVKTMLKEVIFDPFVPWHWGKNQKGMQAGEDLSPEEVRYAKEIWTKASANAATAAQELMGRGVHKQIPNRLLEPFSWIDTLITADRWANFLWLREDTAAEPHLRDLAGLVRHAIEAAEPQLLGSGDWHLPYITGVDREEAKSRFDRVQDQIVFLQKISAARCARISYRPFDGDASYERELERFNLLVNSARVHASPLEHQATPDVWNTTDQNWLKPHLHGNLHGWCQFRKFIPNEAIRHA